jgi:hypothetical protein
MQSQQKSVIPTKGLKLVLTLVATEINFLARTFALASCYIRVANWYFSIPDFANLVFSRGVWYWKFWSGIEAKKWYFLVFWKNVKARN